MPSMAARLLLILGRSVGFAGTALTVALMAWWGQDLFRYAFFSEDPTWDEVGVIPFVVVLRVIVASWGVWSVVGSTDVPCCLCPPGGLRLFFPPLVRLVLPAHGNGLGLPLLGSRRRLLLPGRLRNGWLRPALASSQCPTPQRQLVETSRAEFPGLARLYAFRRYLQKVSKFSVPKPLQSVTSDVLSRQSVGAKLNRHN